MQKSETEKKYSRICTLINEGGLADAMVLIRQWITESKREYFNDELNVLQDNYVNLLKHSFSAVSDPERDKVYTYLKRSMLELADKLKELLVMEKGSGNVHYLKKTLSREQKMERSEAMQLLESLVFDKELAGLLKDVKVGNMAEVEERSHALSLIFNIIWLTDAYTDDEIRLLEAVSDSEKLPWYDKALIVSALTLSLLRYFEVNKFMLLFRFVEKQQEFVAERALVGLFVGFLKYNNRYSLYPVLREKTLALKEFPHIEQHIEAILIQFAKSRETEKVKKKWDEEILPEMMKMRPRIEKKLDLDNLFPDFVEEEEGNPDWQTVFEDAPDLLNKLQELTEMQMDGMDVFISAFAPLKHFPFFRELGNWFVPFYSDNPLIQSSVTAKEDGPDMKPLVDKLEHTYFMCNSDKYSFCLNLGLIPDQQKAMMMNMLNSEMENISEMEKDQKLLNSMARSKSVYTQYFQDLYRFYKLHPWHNEFEDIFDMDMDLYETCFANQLISGSKTIRNIAELLFDKHFYDDALKVFLSILEKDKSNIELFEKIAFCFEKTGDLNSAYIYYQKADLIETGRMWIIRKLAYCCKYLNKWKEALGYYRQAEKLDEEDMRIQAGIGQCLIHLERYGEALDYFFKVEVLAPENQKIRRPLAWCSFLLGKFDTARDYLERLLLNDPDNHHDLINLGHVLWCMNSPAEAFRTYVKSIRACKSIKDFETAFDEDRKHLASHGIDTHEMNLMLDYLKLETRRNNEK
ncbi:MAG: tetratricopeptide repeat protein [Bacteroidales bacterium]|nr:tetratricopeptide repeat protein [Bacteroidales bacterium]